VQTAGPRHHPRREPPDPGIIPGAKDKYRFFVGMDSARLDAILAALQQGMEPEQIASRVEISVENVLYAKKLMEVSAHMRQPPAVPGGD